jgi:hypothetical protein
VKKEQVDPLTNTLENGLKRYSKQVRSQDISQDPPVSEELGQMTRF